MAQDITAAETAALLHRDAIVIDGLVIANWRRSVFENMVRGGLTAANCTCAVWEGFSETMANIARWKRWFVEHDDLILQVRTAEDIHRAKAAGKVGIILGWQNTYAIETSLDNLRLFHDLGVRVMQLTYNTQNLVGSGCWETEDRGLSDYGRDVIDLLNELGIVIDLSHVGEKTGYEAIEHSNRPVAFTHVVPRGILDLPRNKSDDLLTFGASKGAFIGASTYPLFLPSGLETTVDDCVRAFDKIIDLVGPDNVGIGTDFTEGHGPAFFDWLRSDKGDGRPLTRGRISGVPPNPIGMDGPAEYGNLTAAMLRAGWPEDRVRAVMGGNWLRFLEAGWAPG